MNFVVVVLPHSALHTFDFEAVQGHGKAGFSFLAP